MKTRKKVKQQQEKSIVLHNPVELKLRINKFLNPSTTYRIFNNFFIKEQALIKTLEKHIPHQSYFEFNKIVKGKVIGNFIQFTVVPTSREFEFNDDYTIERFLSFGNEVFKKMADSLMALRDLKKEIKFAIDQFPKIQRVLQRFNSEKPLIIWQDDPANYSPDIRNSTASVIVSLSYMNRIGWNNAQEYIFNCIKSGNLCLPFIIDPQSSSPIIDRTQAKIQSLINQIKTAVHRKNVKFLQSSVSQGETIPDERPYSTQRQKHQQSLPVMEVCQQFKTHEQTVTIQFFHSPFLFCGQHVEYKSHNLTQREIDNIDKYDNEEYDLLQKLIHVPQNRLKRYQDKVCSYRQLTLKGEEQIEQD